jgi:DNA mismatch repair protein MutS2
MELDLRGMRVEDGLATLDQYLDSAFLSDLPWVRIIHGKGTGRLRTAVRNALTKNDYVLSWEEGKDGEGGAGVTVAKLISD